MRGGGLTNRWCFDGIIIERCGREGDAVAKIDCDRSSNDSSKKIRCLVEGGWGRDSSWFERLDQNLDGRVNV